MLVYSNIFQPRNDWGVTSMQCRKPVYNGMLISNIAHIINEETGINPLKEIKSHFREDVESRQLFTTMVKLHTSKTLQQIGDIVGGKSHSTIISSLKTVNNLYETNKEY